MKVICDTDCGNYYCDHFDLHDECENCSGGCPGAPFQMCVVADDDFFDLTKKNYGYNQAKFS